MGGPFSVIMHGGLPSSFFSLIKARKIPGGMDLVSHGGMRRGRLETLHGVKETG